VDREIPPPEILERQKDGLQRLIADPSPNKLMPPELQLGLIKGETPEDLRRLFCPELRSKNRTQCLL
jgi:hypothetical protein